MGMTFSGVFTGPALAAFTIGIFIPIANHKGTVIGFLCGSGKI